MPRAVIVIEETEPTGTCRWLEMSVTPCNHEGFHTKFLLGGSNADLSPCREDILKSTKLTWYVDDRCHQALNSFLVQILNEVRHETSSLWSVHLVLYQFKPLHLVLSQLVTIGKSQLIWWVTISIVEITLLPIHCLKTGKIWTDILKFLTLFRL
jgi:hypothetical protein